MALGSQAIAFHCERWHWDGMPKALHCARSFAARILRGVARRVEPPNIWAFLDARQMELGNVPPLDMAALIAAYHSARGECFIVQIGAHTGDKNDPVEQVIRTLGLRAILVEPQVREFAALSAYYADQPQVILERAAIAHEPGEATLYKVRTDFWAEHDFPFGSDSQISSLDREQIGATVEIFGGANLRKDEAAYLDTETVPAHTLDTLLTKHGANRIDLLQIDAEGFDFEIIKMIDWTAPPAIINYETLHLSVPDRQAAWALLRTNGYTLFASDSINTVAIRHHGIN